MRGSSKRIRQVLGAGPVLFLGLAAAAEPAAQGGWDARHMRSNFANHLREPSARPPILGGTRFAPGEEAAPATRVSEQTLSLNPHGWRPGGPSAGSSSARARGGSATFSSTADARPQRGSGRTGSSSSAQRRSHP
jgi:hypothetical protein